MTLQSCSICLKKQGVLAYMPDPEMGIHMNLCSECFDLVHREEEEDFVSGLSDEGYCDHCDCWVTPEKLETHVCVDYENLIPQPLHRRIMDRIQMEWWSLKHNFIKLVFPTCGTCGDIKFKWQEDDHVCDIPF